MAGKANRNHFPLVSGCAMTIHKSQSGTFNDVVYEYQRTHSQPLLYVALSRVTSIEGLYMVSKDNDKKCYHGRKMIHPSYLYKMNFADYR
ncbi:ATP-dependent DNA helicase [Trichonephila clavata]|uniref:ATP-dependent DNA helicase n=1 Tax=Trichonephila clavata TaxID=2740835 RepID=A0A8X6L1Q4_TRICU|nr:ATP-dependent DNA helicase [Trichonephila clavata]